MAGFPHCPVWVPHCIWPRVSAIRQKHWAPSIYSVLLLPLSPEFSQKTNIKRNNTTSHRNLSISQWNNCSHRFMLLSQHKFKTGEERGCFCTVKNGDPARALNPWQWALEKTRPIRPEFPFLSRISKSEKSEWIREPTTQFPACKTHLNCPSRNEGGIQLILKEKKVFSSN